MDNELKQLGLTPNEIKIYNTLLEIGENTVGPIIKKTGMHRQVGYDSLKGLEEKNMVLSTTKNNRLYFRIANPKNILENIKQQESIAKHLIEEVELKLEGQKKGQEIRIYEGEQAYRELMMRTEDRMPENSEYLVITGITRKYKKSMQVSGVFERSNRIRLKKNIKTKLIFSDYTREEAKTLNRVNSEHRFLPEGYESPTAISIWHDTVQLVSYGSEVFCIEIRNEDFRKAYYNYFNLLWKLAKK